MIVPDRPTPISAIGSRDLSPPPVSTLLHGALLRPPALLWNGRRYTGADLDNLDMASARQVPGVVDIVVIDNFIGVIASQARQAAHARNQVQAHWREAVPGAGEQAAAKIRIANDKLPGTAAPGNVSDTGDFSRHYTWPAQGAQEQAWAIAHYTDDTLIVWTACHEPELLRTEIAMLCDMDISAVHVIANGQTDCDGYDAAADAALLTRWCARPVKVQTEDTATGAPQPLELQISAIPMSAEPAEAHPLAQTKTATRPENRYVISSNRYATRRPSVAALLCGYEYDAQPTGITVATSYYPPGSTHIAATENSPISATPDADQSAARIFACESFFDELSRAQNRDAVQARMDTVQDCTGRDLIRAVSDKAGWHEPKKQNNGALAGKGFAYAQVMDNTQEPPRQTWSAWVAEVSIDQATGTIDLTRITVGHNTEALQESAGSAEQLEDHVRNTATRLLRSPQAFDAWGTDEPEASTSYALAQPKVELVAQGQGHELNAELSWSHHAELPAAAAIANAIYDATGVRFRQPPFDTQTLKTRLAKATPSYKKMAYALLGGIAATVTGLVVSAMPWRSAIAPLSSVDTSIYSQAAINRGKLVAAAGDCMVCHTAENGRPNVGGRPLETPFGTVYTTNITPDKKTGIGTWSYAAFERAMRQGIHQDGRHLYPAFPYTAFAKITEPDMQALYAYLMTQEPIQYTPPTTRLAFPFNLRPTLAGWNLLFHRDQTYTPATDQSTLWNRGAYLVQGAGHCAACHSPRNAMGAEKDGKENFLSGGFADGWEAPALNTLSKSPIPWTQDTLYEYLRTGYSSLHGVAAGPMAPVVHSMSELPDSDVRAIAHYLSSLNPPATATDSPAMQAARLEDNSRNNPLAMTHPGENLFEGACAVCHDARSGPPLFGSRPSLALNSNLHSDKPDNVIQVLLHGIADPAVNSLGNMPGFGASMNNQQLETLISYLRLRFAPDKPAWANLGEKIQAVRNTAH